MNDAWTQVGGTLQGAHRIAMSGDGKVVAFWNKNGGDAVEVWKNDGSGTWNQYGDSISEDDGGAFGLTIDLSEDGRTIVIGSLGADKPDPNGIIRAGAAHVFVKGLSKI